jgi:general L-amino acid transport system substrate-binding protein
VVHWVKLAGAALFAGALLLGGCGPKGQGTPEGPVIVTPGAQPTPGATLKAVKARGRVNCGVHKGPGFAEQDAKGGWKGFDVDICRAIAAAVLGDAERVNYLPQLTKTFSPLQTGQVDVLARGDAWTFSRDAGLGLDFPIVSYFDGQGFLVPKKLNLKRASELGRARICVVAATTTESNLVEYFRARKINIARVVLETEDLARQTYEAGGCDALSDDVSNLAAARTLLANPDSAVILPETIAKDPLGPVVRQGDDQWSDIVRWAVAATILGEELGITQANADDMRRHPPNDEVARLLAGDVYGRMLSMRDDWGFQILRQVGNYGEIFARNIGPSTPLALERGENALWNASPPGLMIAPPMR